jgi:hypothetical protein
VAKPTFKIEGLADLSKALGQLPKATGRNVLVRVGKRRMQVIADDMKDRVPERSGDLSDSIIVTTRRPKGGSREPRKSPVEIFAGPGRSPAATQQEFGNENHAPQPYVRPSWDEGADGLLEGIGDDLGDEIAKAAERLAKKQARLMNKRSGG